jgi:hypothetical protein
VLLAFWHAVSELLEVPDRLRRLPQEGRLHADELRRLALDAKGGSRSGVIRLPGLLIRLVGLARSSRELLTPYAPVAALASLWFLAATLAALVASLVLVPLALVVLLVALL